MNYRTFWIWALVIVGFYLAITLLVFVEGCKEEPKVSPLPVVVEPPFLPPTFKAKVKHPARAIFCEPLLGPCYYDDKGLMKVGKRGLKYYEWSDVIVGDSDD